MSRFDIQRRAALRLLLAAAAATLAACGKVGSPVPPADADPRAPRFYPADPRRFERREETAPQVSPDPAFGAPQSQPDAFPGTSVPLDLYRR
jgi:predicted small lipoprotein YifL